MKSDEDELLTALMSLASSKESSMRAPVPVVDASSDDNGESLSEDECSGKPPSPTRAQVIRDDIHCQISQIKGACCFTEATNAQCKSHLFISINCIHGPVHGAYGHIAQRTYAGAQLLCHPNFFHTGQLLCVRGVSGASIFNVDEAYRLCLDPFDFVSEGSKGDDFNCHESNLWLYVPTRRIPRKDEFEWLPVPALIMTVPYKLKGSMGLSDGALDEDDAEDDPVRKRGLSFSGKEYFVNQYVTLHHGCDKKAG
jgi:hypothetical protein